MRYLFAVFAVLTIVALLCLAYVPKTAAVKEEMVVQEQTIGQSPEILEIKASLVRIEGALTKHITTSGKRFDSIEKELRGVKK